MTALALYLILSLSQPEAFDPDCEGTNMKKYYFYYVDGGFAGYGKR